MKKSKRVFTMVIAAVLVLAVMTIPASAALSDQRTIESGAYTGTYSLSMTDTSVTASISVTEGPGFLAENPTCEIMVSYIDSSGILQDEPPKSATMVNKHMSCSVTVDVSGEGLTMRWAQCSYKLNYASLETLTVFKNS